MTKAAYQVLIEKRAEKSLKKFPNMVRLRIRKAMKDLGADPRPKGWKKLEDNACRIRVGRRYRIVYEIDDKQKRVLVTKVGTREGIY